MVSLLAAIVIVISGFLGGDGRYAPAGPAAIRT